MQQPAANGHHGAGSSGPQHLTPSEVAVCDLVAAGHTNREIADELYVTVKAVEFHIHNAFLKLGVQNRTQLAIAHLDRSASSAD